MEFVTIVAVVVVLALALGIYLWATYNALVTLNVRVEEAWSDITVQLKRRADLIPNLIETVKGYAAHEKEVFEAVTKARAQTLSAGDPTHAAEAENMMQTALKSIFAVAEAYPQLQASANFLQLQAELVDTEDKVQASRRFYNGGVRSSIPRFNFSPTPSLPSSWVLGPKTSSRSKTLRLLLTHPASSSSSRGVLCIGR